MKKFGKFAAVATAVLCAAFLLTACGGVKGKYVNTSEQMGITVESTIELKGGDKAIVSAKVKGEIPDEMKDKIGGMEMSVEGTYKIDGEKITITFAGTDQTGTIKDGVITLAGQEYKK